MWFVDWLIGVGGSWVFKAWRFKETLLNVDYEWVFPQISFCGNWHIDKLNQSHRGLFQMYSTFKIFLEVKENQNMKSNNKSESYLTGFW